MKSSTSSTRSSVYKRPLLLTWPLLVMPILVHAQTVGSQAATRTQSVALAPVNQAWPGKRVALVLPLRTGTAWNANPEFTQMFLPQAQSALREALSRTGKFSVLEVRRFNPVLMRAVQDGAATTDDLNTLLNQPTVPNAGVFLSKTSFNRAPLQSFATSATIGSFVMESVEQNENGLRLKVTGRMYDPGSITSSRALSATVTVPYNFASGSARAPGIIAANVGFDRVLQEFTRYPTERELPIVSAPTAMAVAPATSSTSSEVSTTTITTTSNTVLLPGTPIAGASSRPLTADGRAMMPSSMMPSAITSTTSTTTSTTSMSTSPLNNSLGLTPGMTLPAGITIEVETPPAEVFPAAPAPVENGGGNGTESVDGTEAVDDTTGATTVDDTAAGNDTATSGDTATTNDSSTDNSVDDSDSDGGGSPDTSSSGGSSDSGNSSGNGGGATTGTSGDSGDGITDDITDVMPPEDSNEVTTVVSPRIRDRAPGEIPSFER